MPKNVDPTRQQLDEFKSLPRDTPIMILNLIKLRAESVYPDGTVMTGAQAYQAYTFCCNAVNKICCHQIVFSFCHATQDGPYDGSMVARAHSKFYVAIRNSGCFGHHADIRH